MKRITIEVTEQQQQRLKAMAALQGQTIKDFVLASTIGSEDEQRALAELEELLDTRMDRARREGFSKRSVEAIFEKARQEAGLSPNG